VWSINFVNEETMAHWGLLCTKQANNWVSVSYEKSLFHELFPYLKIILLRLVDLI